MRPAIVDAYRTIVELNYIFFRTVLGVRRSIPQPDSFAYAPGGLLATYVWVITLTAPLEALFFYVAIPDHLNWLRDTLLVASIELVILSWGLRFAIAQRPHLVGSQGLALHWGNLVSFVVPYGVIAGVNQARSNEPSGRFGVTFHPDRPEAFMSNLSETNVTLELARLARIPAWLTPKKPVSRIHLHVARPAEFVAAVQQKLAMVNPSESGAEVEIKAGSLTSTALNSRTLVLLTLMLEIPLLALGYAWMLRQGIDVRGAVGFTWKHLLAGIGLGILVSAATILLLSLTRTWGIFAGWRQWTARTLTPFLGKPSVPAILLLAVMAGLGEEMFFRGAMQPLLGVWATALIFAAVHIGVPRREAIPFFVYILIHGILFGLLRYTGWSLCALMAAHATINFGNAIYLRTTLVKSAAPEPLP